MPRCRLILGLALVLALPALARADDPKLWKLTYFQTPTNSEVTNWIIKLDIKDGKAEGSLVNASGGMKTSTLKNVTVEKGMLRVTIKITNGELVFQGKLPEKDAKVI